MNLTAKLFLLFSLVFMLVTPCYAAATLSPTEDSLWLENFVSFGVVSHATRDQITGILISGADMAALYLFYQGNPIGLGGNSIYENFGA